jgi:heme exporter protein C
VAIAAAAVAPVDVAMGPIQRLFYLHLPVAINTFMAASVVFVACVGYLGSRRGMWDDLAYAAARVTVLNGTVLLLTGMFWARVSWGEWWVWSPRLGFSLLLWLLYLVYLVLRPAAGPGPRGALMAAVYGIVAFFNVPLFYLTANMLPDVHRFHMEVTPAMEWALLLWFVAITMLTGGLIAARFSLSRRESEESVAQIIFPRSRGTVV